MLPQFYGVFAWSLLLACSAVGLLARFKAFSKATKYLLLLFTAGMFCLPMINHLAIGQYLVGFFDVPSVAFCLIVVARFIEPSDSGLKVLWHVGGIICVVIVASYLFGLYWLFEMGYQRWTLWLLLAYCMVLSFSQGIAGLLVLVLISFSAALKLMDSHNTWLYITDASYAFVYLVSSIFSLARICFSHMKQAVKVKKDSK